MRPGCYVLPECPLQGAMPAQAGSCCHLAFDSSPTYKPCRRAPCRAESAPLQQQQITARWLLTCIVNQLLCRESMGDSQRAGHDREGGFHDMRATQLLCHLV